MLRQVAKNHANACVMLVRLDRTARAVNGVGSAFLCHNSGYLLTCAHTFALTDELGIVAPSQSDEFAPMSFEHAEVIEVKVAQYDAVNDVALLKLPDSAAVVVPNNLLMPEREVQLGASVACVGYPFSNRGLHTRHISLSTVSGKVLSASGTKQFQLDAMIHEGNSGGPVIDVSTNQILGIVSGRFPANANSPWRIDMGGYTPGTDSAIAYAISIEYGLQLLRAERCNG